MRAFLHGAWGGALGLLLGGWGPAWLFGGEISLYFPLRVENSLSFAPWMLAGGLVGLAARFYQERRIQFSLLLLLLITTLCSLSAAKFSLADSRFRGEKRALAVLEERFGPEQGLGIDAGFIYEKITGIGFSVKAIDADDISFLTNQLKHFPCLRKMVLFSKESLSDADLATLKTEFPNIEIAREW